MLGGILSIVNLLASRLTDTRAGYLDASISSRAPSSTALSNVTWTDQKAGYLDASVTSRAAASTALSNVTWTDQKAGYLDAAISSVGLKSVQYGLVDTSSVSSGSAPESKYVDVTISEVVVANSFVIHDVCVGVDDSASNALSKARRGAYGAVSPADYAGQARAYLYNTTTLRIFATGGTYTGFSGRWQVVEFN